MASDVDRVQRAIVTRMALLYLLSAWALLQLTAARNCTDLIVYDGERMLNGPRVNTSEDCSNGLRGFPDELALGESVANARDFQVIPFSTKTEHNNTVNGLSFGWKVPLPGSSRKHLKGFYLEMEKSGTGTKLCTMFDVRHINMTNSLNIHFSYSCTFNNTREETYRILLLSLPPPSAQEYEQGLHDRTSISVPGSRDMTKVDPSEWTTWVSVRLHSTESKIEVNFGYPQNGSVASFDNYWVELINMNTGNKTKVNVQSTFPSKTFGEYNFTNVQSGTYQVQVQPKRDNCKCFQRILGLNLKNCDAYCRISKTKQFNFTTMNFSETTMVLDNTTRVPEGEVSTTRIVPAAVNMAVVIPAVVVPLAMAALLSAVICFWRHRKSTAWRARLGRNGTDGDNDSASSQAGSSQGMFVPLPSDRLPAPLISRKSVLLLASEDHKYFSQALHSFAAFLSLHCQCDVMFAPQQLGDVRKENSCVWLSRMTDNFDFVVIIAPAEAAFTLCQKYHKGRVHTSSADMAPEGVILRRGNKHIDGKMVCDAEVSKVIMVHFEHPSAEYRLPTSALPTCFYRLPARLKPFLLHLHGLDEATMDLSRVNLPLQGNVGELAGGSEWLEAVQTLKPADRPSSKHSNDSGFADGVLSSSHRRGLSSVSAQAVEDAPVLDHRLARGGSFSKSDFIAPSAIGSVYTVNPSAFTDLVEGKSQIDDSTLSQQLRLVNTHYEQDRRQEEEEEERNRHQQEMDAVAQQRVPPVSDENDFAQFALQQFDGPHVDFVSEDAYDSDRNNDCFSIITAQSV